MTCDALPSRSKLARELAGDDPDAAAAALEVCGNHEGCMGD
jgi:hypothetical protein